VDDLLNAEDARDVPWGIVTNKPTALTGPILEILGLAARAGTVVCGDTLAESKPHPAPVRHALKALAATPGASWYLGDAERDVIAAHRAGMRVAVALWGYLGEHDDPARWGADACLDNPAALVPWLFKSTEGANAS
jgi:phosphoglycolate phosphatase